MNSLAALETEAWFIDPNRIMIHRREDGSEWLMGVGAYGEVGSHTLLELESWRDSYHYGQQQCSYPLLNLCLHHCIGYRV